MKQCNFCNKIIRDDATYCTYCGEEYKTTTADDCIIIDPDKVQISKRRNNSFSIFGDSMGFSSFGRSGGGFFGSIFSDLLGGFFGFDEPEEEYCDFRPEDERFINPNVKIIDPKKMIVFSKEDIEKVKKRGANN